MFYPTDGPHGLTHDPFKAIVAPRPIGWISTLDGQGRANLGPYSFFNAISDSPKAVIFSSGGLKDSAANAIETGEFTCNFVTRRLTDAMNASSAGLPHGVDEFEVAGLEKADGVTVRCPRVALAPAALECKVVAHLRPPTLAGGENDYIMVVGEVTGVHIADDHIRDGRFDTHKADPLMRAGYRDYAGITPLFALARPDDGA